MSSEEQIILQEIAGKLSHHITWSFINFWGLQILLWVSIGGSFACRSSYRDYGSTTSKCTADVNSGSPYLQPSKVRLVWFNGISITIIMFAHLNSSDGK
jgi:hypothetical protein